MIAIAHEPETSDVFAVVEEVWSTFLGREEPLFPDLHASTSDPLSGDPALWTAAVTVTGAWEAVIRVSLADKLAGTVTDRMLGLDDDSEPRAPEDVTDALGELVNVIGGNIKSLMPGPSKLSLPLVAPGPIASTSSMVEVCRLDLSWARQLVRVSVSVSAASQGAAS
jgi:chemotaxis protein CheX